MCARAWDAEDHQSKEWEKRTKMIESQLHHQFFDFRSSSAAFAPKVFEVRAIKVMSLLHQRIGTSRSVVGYASFLASVRCFSGLSTPRPALQGGDCLRALPTHPHARGGWARCWLAGPRERGRIARPGLPAPSRCLDVEAPHRRSHYFILTPSSQPLNPTPNRTRRGACARGGGSRITEVGTSRRTGFLAVPPKPPTFPSRYRHASNKQRQPKRSD